MGRMKYFHRTHADIGSEKLNGLPEIKLQFVAQPGAEREFPFFSFFPFLLLCISRQAIISELDLLP